MIKIKCVVFFPQVLKFNTFELNNITCKSLLVCKKLNMKKPLFKNILTFVCVVLLLALDVRLISGNWATYYKEFYSNQEYVNALANKPNVSSLDLESK